MRGPPNTNRSTAAPSPCPVDAPTRGPQPRGRRGPCLAPQTWRRPRPGVCPAPLPAPVEGGAVCYSPCLVQTRGPCPAVGADPKAATHASSVAGRAPGARQRVLPLADEQGTPGARHPRAARCAAPRTAGSACRRSRRHGPCALGRVLVCHRRWGLGKARYGPAFSRLWTSTVDRPRPLLWTAAWTLWTATWHDLNAIQSQIRRFRPVFSAAARRQPAVEWRPRRTSVAGGQSQAGCCTGA